MKSIAELSDQFPRAGHLHWIGIRVAKRQALLCVEQAMLNVDQGLCGDHYRGRSGKRQVTLLQQEHLAVIESFTGQLLDVQLLRRNLLVSGINLAALKNRQFMIGDTVLLATGLCHPCSRMESVLGSGGYNALRGHGGISAQVLKGGLITVGDRVIALHQQ